MIATGCFGGIDAGARDEGGGIMEDDDWAKGFGIPAAAA